MLDGMSDSIQGSRIENLHSREVDHQSPTGLIFFNFLSTPTFCPHSRNGNVWNTIILHFSTLSLIVNFITGHVCVCARGCWPTLQLHYCPPDQHACSLLTQPIPIALLTSRCLRLCLQRRWHWCKLSIENLAVSTAICYSYGLQFPPHTPMICRLFELWSDQYKLMSLSLNN